MVKLISADDTIETIGFVSLARSSVDRSKWKFDEDGFAQANNAALLAARQAMQETILTLHQDIVRTLHPNAYSRSIDGVDGAPIDAIK